MNKLLALAVFPLVVALSSCTDDPTSSQVSSLSGDVQLYDQDGSRLADNSGVAVSIKGTTFVTVTTVDGKWEIDDVPAGVYTVIYEKSGYPHVEQQNTQFVGNGEYFVSAQNIGEIPTFSVATYSVQPEGSYYNISGTISEGAPDGKGRLIGLFYKVDPNEDFHYYYDNLLITYTAPESSTTFSGQVSLENLRKKGIVPAGATIYLKIIPLNREYAKGTYYDYTSEKTFWTALWPDGGTQVIPVTVP